MQNEYVRTDGRTRDDEGVCRCGKIQEFYKFFFKVTMRGIQAGNGVVASKRMLALMCVWPALLSSGEENMQELVEALVEACDKSAVFQIEDILAETLEWPSRAAMRLSDKTFRCKKCGPSPVLGCLGELQAHVVTFHGWKESAKEETELIPPTVADQPPVIAEPSVIDWSVCSDADSRYRRMRNVCRECGLRRREIWAFSSTRALSEHHVAIHGRKKCVNFNSCGKMFRANSSKYSHERECVKDPRQCSVCESGNLQGIHRHFAKFHPRACPECFIQTYTYHLWPSERRLADHRLEQHEAQSCDNYPRCLAVFRAEKNRRNHARKCFPKTVSQPF